MPEITTVDIALIVIFLLVLALPFKVRIVEHNLEPFLFIMGALAVTVTAKWGLELIETAALEPVEKGIVPAVLIAGLLFHFGQRPFQRAINGILRAVPQGVFIFAIVVILGLISSVITAIIASLLLVEIANLMPLARKQKVNLVIISCFSIGLGAALTPLGEPLATIAVSKLAGAPYHASFFYLLNHLGILVVLGVLACGAFSVVYLRRSSAPVPATAAAAIASGAPAGPGADTAAEGVCETADNGGLREVIIRTVKVYLFVAALFLLGAGMEVIIEKYLLQVPAYILYWVNMVSAILDNATLAAAEIGPAMSQTQITAALMGLLIAGGMLIPGNIPNIISAGKLGITSAEWAKLGVPVGLVLMVVYFVLVFLLGWTPTLNLG